MRWKRGEYGQSTGRHAKGVIESSPFHHLFLSSPSKPEPADQASLCLVTRTSAVAIVRVPRPLGLSLRDEA